MSSRAPRTASRSRANDYNDAVKSYNSRIITFPNRLVAGMFGFEKAEYFTAPESAQSAPDVNFDA